MPAHLRAVMYHDKLLSCTMTSSCTHGDADSSRRWDSRTCFVNYMHAWMPATPAVPFAVNSKIIRTGGYVHLLLLTGLLQPVLPCMCTTAQKQHAQISPL